MKKFVLLLVATYEKLRADARMIPCKRATGSVWLSLILILIAPYLPILQAASRTTNRTIELKTDRVSKSSVRGMHSMQMPLLPTTGVSPLLLHSMADLSDSQTLPTPLSLSIRVDRTTTELEFARKVILAITEHEKLGELPIAAINLRAILKASLAQEKSPFCVVPLIVAALAAVGIVVAAEVVVQVCVMGAVVCLVAVAVLMAIDAFSDPIGDAIRAQLDALWAELAALQELLANLEAAGFWAEVDQILDEIAAKWEQIYDALARLHEHFYPGSGSSNFLGVVGYYDDTTGRLGAGPGLRTGSSGGGSIGLAQ